LEFFLFEESAADEYGSHETSSFLVVGVFLVGEGGEIAEAVEAVFDGVGVDDVGESEGVDPRAALFGVHVVLVFGVHLLSVKYAEFLLEGGTEL
jgi:hypothetical protein